MRPLYRNLFLLFGVVAIGIMLYTFDTDYDMLRDNIARAGLYLPAVLGVWIFVYLFNALAFQIIVNNGRHDKPLSLSHASKHTQTDIA